MLKFTQHRFLKLFAIYIAAIIIGVALSVVFKGGPKIHATMFYLVVITGLTLYSKNENSSLKKWLIKPQRDGLKRTVTMAVIILLMTLFIIAIRTAVWKEGITETFQFDVFVFIGTCLLAPITEEILCRGIIVDILSEKHGNAFVIIISSVIFYIIHGNPINVGALLFGILASWSILKTKSIIPGVVIHFIWNTSIYFLPVIAKSLSKML